MCHTNPQVSSRFTIRLLAALLLALVAFGAAGSSASVSVVSHAIARADRKGRRAPRCVPEQRGAAIVPRAVRAVNSPSDPRPPATFIHRWLFQRPPPGALPVHA